MANHLQLIIIMLSSTVFSTMNGYLKILLHISHQLVCNSLLSFWPSQEYPKTRLEKQKEEGQVDDDRERERRGRKKGREKRCESGG